MPGATGAAAAADVRKEQGRGAICLGRRATVRRSTSAKIRRRHLSSKLMQVRRRFGAAAPEWGSAVGQLDPTRLEPVTHGVYLLLLLGDDVFGQLHGLRVLPGSELDARYVDRALVVRDHSEHEGDVGVSVPESS